MNKIKKSDLNFLKESMRLSNNEAENAAKFINKHREGKTGSHSFNNVKYTIAFSETSLGNFVKIECEKCHTKKHIQRNTRSISIQNPIPKVIFF